MKPRPMQCTPGNSGVNFDPDAPCSGCGQFGAYAFDGTLLCGECYEKRGSCCPEFGADDLWTREAAPEKPGAHPPTPPAP